MAELDGLVLNGVNINDLTNYGLEAINFPPPSKRPEWAQGADSDGENLIRTPLYNNRSIPVTLRIGRQASMDVALEKIGALVDLFQEAEKNPEGIPLVWTPAKATKKYTLYVLTGEVVEIPQVVEGADAGFYVEMPRVKVMMVARPFGYGTEEEVAAAKSIETGLSVVILTVPSVLGDVPAEGRLVVKDTAAVGRRFVEWGLENRYYNAATSLIQASEALTAVGGALSEAANTGAYKGGAGTKNTIATTLVGEPTVCAETGVLKHVGSFRVKCRGQVVLGSESLAQNVFVRLSYQDGEGPFRANPWQPLQLGGKYAEIDLGPVTLTEKVTGTQKWVGRIEAYSTNTAAKDVFHVNYLGYVPTEGYGKAVGPSVASGGTVAAYDDFTGGSGALNARTPEIGAAWATSGAAADWTLVASSLAAGTIAAERKTKSDTEPRFGVFGAALGSSAIFGGVASAERATGGRIVQGLILRWTNSSNYAFALAERGGVTSSFTYYLVGTVVAGVRTVLAETKVGGIPNVAAGSEITFTATLDGALTLAVRGGITLSASSSAIAAGGTLASGKAGIYDQNKGTTEVPRVIDNVSVVTLPGIPYCIQPSRSMEARSDTTITADSTGTYYGPVPQYRGARFYLPQSGSAARTSRILVKADRNDLEEADQQTIGDAFTAQVWATARYSVIPR